MDELQPEIYIQPDYPAEMASDWVILAASIQGTSHLKNGLPCQDTHAHQIINNHRLIAVVADGLGSAPLSDLGSRLAVGTAVQYLNQFLLGPRVQDEQSWIDLMRSCFQAARNRLVSESEARNEPLRSFATTLIVAIIDDDWLVCGQIGDGAVVVGLADGSLELITTPQNDEYVNVTYPLTMPDMENAAQFIVWNGEISTLAMMTDGVQHISIRSADQQPHAPFFEPLFRQLPGVKNCHKASLNLANFLASEQINSHTDDDKTLVLIGRKIK